MPQYMTTERDQGKKDATIYDDRGTKARKASIDVSNELIS